MFKSNLHPLRSMLLAPAKRPFDSTCTGLLRKTITAIYHYRRNTRRSIMEGSGRTYSDALSLLNSLQSNKTIVKEIKQSDRDMNLDAIPEMLEWVRKAGYKVEDFNKLRVIHVAGTKGKGSVCAFIASILQQYGHVSDIPQAATEDVKQNLGMEAKGLGKIGLYTSPHLVTVRERIRINNDPISQSLFTSHFFNLWDRFSASAAAAGHANPIDPETKPGYFRYLTIMALHVFLHEGVRTAIIECGIGGEYDSTNILTKEAVTVATITRLGIDHVGVLGTTLEEIAWHKSGIMKEGIECLTVPQEPEAMRVLKYRAREKKAGLNVIERMEAIEMEGVRIGLEGDFQKDNASLAVAVARTHLNKTGFGDVLRDKNLPAEFLRGLEHVKWEGRCEVIKEGSIEWCIDGAHTMESINITAQWFASKLQKGTKRQAMLIFNQQDRDGAALALALHLGLERATGARHIFSNAVFCTNNPYKLGVDEDGTGGLGVQRLIANAWNEFEPDTEIEIYSSIEEAVESARELSKDSEKLLVLITGSLHLVGGFLQVLRGR